MRARIRYWTATIEAHGGTVAAVEHGNHLKFRLGCGALFVVSNTPTDWRSDLNHLAHLRRMLGWQRPKPAHKTKEKARSKRKDSFDAAPPARGFVSPGRQQVLDEERRKRLGLAGSRVPKCKPAASRRPVLTLKGIRSLDPRSDDLGGVVL